MAVNLDEVVIKIVDEDLHGLIGGAENDQEGLGSFNFVSTV